jgi:hypothetical protein
LHSVTARCVITSQQRALLIITPLNQFFSPFVFVQDCSRPRSGSMAEKDALSISGSHMMTNGSVSVWIDRFALERKLRSSLPLLVVRGISPMNFPCLYPRCSKETNQESVGGRLGFTKSESR